MTLIEMIISVLILGSIVGGILLLKKTAKKFNLTPEQLADIKKRNEVLDKEDQQNK
jgi:Tfp pilus assembly protein PilV